MADEKPVRHPHEEAVNRLQPLRPVLRGFAHRNRNQHRRAAWWACFGMLRRHVEKLVDELALLSSSSSSSAASSHSLEPRRLKGKKQKGERTKKGEGGRKDQVTRTGGRGTKGDEMVGKVRARWLRDVLVPRCYLAFSQLVADNQFAVLGTVLLAALAQVNAACVCLVGVAPDPLGGAEEVEDVVITSLSEPARSGDLATVNASIRLRQQQQQQRRSVPTRLPLSSPLGPGPIEANDGEGGLGGKAISREEVAARRAGSKLPQEGETTADGEKIRASPQEMAKSRDHGSVDLDINNDTAENRDDETSAATGTQMGGEKSSVLDITTTKKRKTEESKRLPPTKTADWAKIDDLDERPPTVAKKRKKGTSSSRSSKKESKFGKRTGGGDELDDLFKNLF